MHLWLLREPSLCFGLPVYICAALVFPLHLGWTGASASMFAGYMLVAALLFSMADALFQPSLYPRWLAIIPQSLLSLMALALPAVLAFTLGATLGPVEERLDGQFCASTGSGEQDSPAAEADDAFDVTPDCTPD